MKTIFFLLVIIIFLLGFCLISLENNIEKFAANSSKKKGKKGNIESEFDTLKEKKTILTKKADAKAIKITVSQHEVFSIGSLIEIGITSGKHERRSVIKIIPNKKILKLNKPLVNSYPEKTLVKVISKKTYLTKDDKLSEKEKNLDFTLKQVEESISKDNLLENINKLKTSKNNYHPNEISRYGSKLKFLKEFKKKPGSFSCNKPFGRDIPIEIEDKYKNKLFKTVDTKSLLSIGLNRWDIVNPNNDNTILPHKVFSYQQKSKKRVLDYDIFKTEIIDKIEKVNSVNTNNEKFEEIKNPIINIYKKNKFQIVPYKYFFRILDFQKTKLDKLLFEYASHDDKQIICEKPVSVTCETKLLFPQIYKISETSNWYKFEFKYNYYIKDKVFAYTLLSKAFIHKKNNKVSIQTLLLKGVLHEQYINLNEGKNSFEPSLNNLLHIDNNVIRENGSVFSKYNPEKGYLSDDNEEPILFDKDEQVKLVRKHKVNYDNRLSNGSEVPEWYKTIVNKPMTETQTVVANKEYITRT